jgi:uncharacterized membrane protein
MIGPAYNAPDDWLGRHVVAVLRSASETGILKPEAISLGNMDLLEQSDVSPTKAWLGAFFAIVVTIIGAILAFPKTVYDQFIWRYFIGPVRADATTVDCLVYRKGSNEILAVTDGTCSSGAYDNAFVVTEGYTVLSTLGYITILVFMLAGVYLLLDQFDLRPYSKFFYALVPFMLFGGALRTVEDSFVAALSAGETPLLEYPASGVLISPFIYFTVFAIALASFLASKWLARREITETYYYPLGVMGTIWLASTFSFLLWTSFTTDYARFHASILLLVLGIATIVAVGAYYGVDRQWPEINEATGLMGLVVIWGHAIDGVANVIANDWTHLWDIGEYGAKHPFNQFIMDTTNALQGGSELAGVYVGTAWPFLLVKIAAPILIISLFDEQFFDESPRFSVMLLGAVVAVGLGPGTRDMIRITFGI